MSSPHAEDHHTTRPSSSSPHCMVNVRPWLQWHSADFLLQPGAPLRSTPPPMPAPTDSSGRRSSTGQRGYREHHSSSPVPMSSLRRKSGLDFELALWKRALDKRAADKRAADKRAAKKSQVGKLAALKLAVVQRGDICDRGNHIARNADANRAITQPCSGIVLPSDTKHPSVLLPWGRIFVLAFVAASVVTVCSAVWAV